MFVVAFVANAHCRAFGIIDAEFEQTGATLAGSVGEVMYRIGVVFAVTSQFFADVGLRIAVEVFAFLLECHFDVVLVA